MHYQLFLPNSTKPNGGSFADWLSAVGLEDHHDGHSHVMETGPAGEGALVGWIHSRSNQRQITYRPEQQTWLPALPLDGQEAGRYWVGFDNANPPQENELRRSYTQVGEFMQLGADRWKVPTLNSVPQEAQYRDDGSMQWVAIREYAWLSDEAQKMRAEVIMDFEQRLVRLNDDPAEFVAWALRLLRVNYRMLPEVATRLHLWKSDDLIDVVLRSLGMKRAGEESSDG